MIHEVSHFEDTNDYFYAKHTYISCKYNYIKRTEQLLTVFNKQVDTKDDPNIAKVINKNSGIYTAKNWDESRIVKDARALAYEKLSRMKVALKNADHIALIAMKLGVT